MKCYYLTLKVYSFVLPNPVQRNVRIYIFATANINDDESDIKM